MYSECQKVLAPPNRTLSTFQNNNFSKTSQWLPSAPLAPKSLEIPL